MVLASVLYVMLSEGEGVVLYDYVCLVNDSGNAGLLSPVPIRL